jgi:hypothetical protein
MTLVEVLRTHPDITDDVRKRENDFEDGKNQDFPPGQRTFKNHLHEL